MIGLDERRFWSTAAGKPFFQPLDLHVEPADLLVEFGLAGLSLLPLAAAAVAEEGVDVVEEMLLPLADLDRVNLERLGESAAVLVCLAASKATFALKAAGCRFFVPAITHLGME